MLKKKYFYKIYLNCRRGMLELDLVLLNFLEIEYFNLDDCFLAKFEKLLSQSDVDLYSWLIKGELCEDDCLVSIISKIRTVTSNLKFS